jgi:hypothetical protein
VLANVVRKPMQQIFSEFTGIKSGDQGTFTGTGDVKYHLGTSYDRPTITGKRVHLSLLANPSHLEVKTVGVLQLYHLACLLSSGCIDLHCMRGIAGTFCIAMHRVFGRFQCAHCQFAGFQIATLTTIKTCASIR